MVCKPGDPRPNIKPEKMALPNEATVLEYINSCAVPPSLRDITRAFKIGQDQRASMRRMLRDMAERGILAGDRRGIAAPDTLPEVAVLELTEFDDNGDGMARQAGNEDENQP
jgi:ribonuclease R